MSFIKIKPEDIEKNTFEVIGNNWLLLTAGNMDSYNTMTVSWGGLGVLWKKNVATVYVRPQRYTYEFMEKNDYFTLSAYPETMHDKLALCGSKSGRDIDKVASCGFTPKSGEAGGVYFDEAEFVLVCRKLYYNDFDPKHFLVPEIEDCYTNHDYHRMYIGEIVEALVKK
ncbi:MAG: flavin reductase family protein [Oscillospiraceae bacterium]